MMFQGEVVFRKEQVQSKNVRVAALLCPTSVLNVLFPLTGPVVHCSSQLSARGSHPEHVPVFRNCQPLARCCSEFPWFVSLTTAIYPLVAKEPVTFWTFSFQWILVTQRWLFCTLSWYLCNFAFLREDWALDQLECVLVHYRCLEVAVVPFD